MFIATNLKIFLMALLPAITYGMIIYISSRYRSISIKKGLGYFALGAISVTFVNAFQFTFPYYQDWVLNESMPILSTLFKAIFQIALLEELCKLSSYRFIDSVRHRVELKRDKPVATMFYACMVSAGFAVIENLHYVMAFFDKVAPSELLLTRALSAVIVHMVCGLFMGYFIALGNLKSDIDISIISVILRKNPRWRQGLYSTLGVTVAILYHGIYDFMAFINSNLFNIIVVGLLIAYIMHKQLNSISGVRKIR